MRGNANTYTLTPTRKSYADSYFYSNSHPNRNSHSNVHANSNGHRNSDTYRNANGYSSAYTNPNRHTNTELVTPTPTAHRNPDSNSTQLVQDLLPHRGLVPRRCPVRLRRGEKATSSHLLFRAKVAHFQICESREWSEWGRATWTVA